MQIDLEPKRPLVAALGVTAAIFNFVLVVSAATPAEPPPPTPKVIYLRLDEVRVHKPIEDRINQCSRPCYGFYSSPTATVHAPQDAGDSTTILFSAVSPSLLTPDNRAMLGRLSAGWGGHRQLN
jgi:hypothetical protein